MMSPKDNNTGKHQRQRGFTLAEAAIALAVGTVVVGVAMMAFKNASDAGQFSVTRSNSQQSARAALNVVLRDLGQAAISFPQAGVPLPSGTGTSTLFGCSGCVAGSNTYPNNVMAPVNPGDNKASNGTTDTITVVYNDPTWPPTAQPVTPASDGSSITVSTANFADPNGVLRKYNDTTYGSAVGDIMLVYNSNGYAVGYVTAIGAGGVLSLSPGTSDPLQINQTTAPAGNISWLQNLDALGNKTNVYPNPTSAKRIKAVTYFIQNAPGPDGISGTADDIPVLMRQVNGQTAVPVADYVQNFQITYDTFNDSTSTLQTQLNGGSVTDSTLIRKITITLQIRSPQPIKGNNFDVVQVTGSVSPRDLSFKDRYN